MAVNLYEATQFTMAETNQNAVGHTFHVKADGESSVNLVTWQKQVTVQEACQNMPTAF